MNSSTLSGLLGRVALAAAALVGGPALAATQTLTGATFDVQYDDALLGLFGAPSLVGNTIYFTPTNYKAESVNGQGFVTANSTINLKILPHLDEDLASVALLERGDYSLEGAGSFVRVTGQLRSFSIDNPLYEITSSITPSAPLNVADGSLHNWQATAALNYAADAQLAYSRGVNVTLENLLRAYTSTSLAGPSLAFIEKKFTGGAVSLTVTTVPEPGSFVLLGAGLLVLARTVNRRSVQAKQC